MSLLSRVRLLCLSALLVPVLPASAKVPGQTICYNDVCHRVRTLTETAAEIGTVHTVLASFYDDPRVDPMNPRLETSSGEQFDPAAPNNAASPIWPDGTILLVRAPASRTAAVVRINNAGPYSGERMIDLSRGLADALGISKLGVARVETVVLAAPSENEARYARGRSYPPVAGVIGTYESVDDAHMIAATTATSTAVMGTVIVTGSIAPLKRAATVLLPLRPLGAAAPALVAVHSVQRRRASNASPDSPDVYGQNAWSRALVINGDNGR
jgi:rare lipoprotein A (peptidoglycan hydrolase)